MESESEPKTPYVTESGRDEVEEQNQDHLPPMDGGQHAWLFLAACFLIEGLVWGFSFAFGVFQDYYSTHEPFKGSNDIAVIGTCGTGVIFLFTPVMFGVLICFPRLKRWSTPVGFVIMALTIGISSFATTTTQLIVSQGICYGLGSSIAYTPTIMLIDEWFCKKKGLAFGIMMAGCGVSGLVLPVFLEWLLNTHGYQTALRTWAVVLFALAAPVLYFVKPRIPVSKSKTGLRDFDFSFARDRAFLVHQAGNIMQGLGYFIPSIYMPSFAASLGASPLLASVTIMLFNLASIFGSIVIGALVDRNYGTICILICALGTGLSTFLLWGFSVSLAPLYIFSLIYGACAGSWTSTWPIVVGDVRKKYPLADQAVIMPFLIAGRGIGNVISGPLSDALLAGDPWPNAAGAYGSEYGPLIIFTGISAILSGVGVVVRLLKS